MKKLLLLPLAAALIFSLGCSRELPASSGAATPASAAAEAVPAKTPGQSTTPPASSQPDAEPFSEAAPSEGASQSAAQQPEAAPNQPDAAAERDWRLPLVNPDHLIPEGWKPELTMTKYGYEVDSRIVEDLSALIDGAAEDGVSLLICYGYRTVEQSQQLFDKQIKRQLANGLSQEAALIEAARWVAPPGTSDHHTGLALDIVTPEYQVLNHGFYDTPAGRWMDEHSWEYGFVIRFPKDKQEITGITYEPWHLRFVGKEHAAAMHEQNLCLEEYVELLYGE